MSHSRRSAFRQAFAIGLAAGLGSTNAWADPFQFASFQAGAGLPGVRGEGFQTTSGDFFKSSFNPGVTAGPFAFFGNAPDLEFDTYFSIDAIGPSRLAGSLTDDFYGGGEHEAMNTSTTAGLTLAPGSNITGDTAQIGVGVFPQPFFSGIAPDGRDGVFIMRATVDEGESVVGGACFFLLTDDPNINVLLDVRLDGPSVPALGQNFGLEAYLVSSSCQNGGLGDTYDLWFQIVPCDGDANGDGIVNFKDIREVIRHWRPQRCGPGAPSHAGDPDRNGVVDFGDLAEVLAHWLEVCL